MRTSPLLAFLLGCGSGSSALCPPTWTSSASAPGSCEAPSSYTSALPGGVYGFVRTEAHGSDQLVVGSAVFAVPASNTTCTAASANAIATGTTDDNGVFSLSVPAGEYRITSGEVPSCVLVTVDAMTPTEVALTYP